MKNYESQYREILTDCLKNGTDKNCRSEVKQRSVFGKQITVDLQKEFPLLTARKIYFKIIAAECLWILNGHTNIDFLHRHNVHIWDAFADKDGNVGPMYQWRNWNANGTTYDQLQTVISEIKNNPESKRLVVSSWNVHELENMSLPPCPHMFQFMTENGKLHMHLTQRAGDLILGVPYDIGVYALLTHIVAHITGLQVGNLYHNIADAHIYHDHLDIAEEILNEKTLHPPLLSIEGKCERITDFSFEHFLLENYRASSKIQAAASVGPLFKTYFGTQQKKHEIEK